LDDFFAPMLGSQVKDMSSRIPFPAHDDEAVADAIPVVTAGRMKQGVNAVNLSTAEIDVLSEEECLELLRSHHVGRIALTDHGQPLIFPVNYAADDRAVVFRTGPGMKLQESRMSRVAFEIDEVDTAAGTAWSVMVKGIAYDITDAGDSLSERLRELVVETMAPGDRPNWVAVMRNEISGRRFRLVA
jgi:nitroimidazol reductase NimA-like FMN-containing flavoprotein (pyridoxamine 5'-phosphate oxidase superfamily)